MPYKGSKCILKNGSFLNHNISPVSPATLPHEHHLLVSSIYFPESTHKGLCHWSNQEHSLSKAVYSGSAPSTQCNFFVVFPETHNTEICVRNTQGQHNFPEAHCIL